MSDKPILWKHKDSLFSSYTDTSSNDDFSVETIMERKPDGSVIILSVNIIPKIIADNVNKNQTS